MPSERKQMGARTQLPRPFPFDSVELNDVAISSLNNSAMNGLGSQRQSFGNDWMQ